MVPLAACCVRAARSAERRALRLTLTLKSRGVGGNATPPPVQCGARVVPARARPVPFWRHGLARPPETRPRLFAPRVPARRAFSSAPKPSPSSVTCFVDLPAASSRGALVVDAAGMRLLLPDLDDAVLRAWDRTL